MHTGSCCQGLTTNAFNHTWHFSLHTTHSCATHVIGPQSQASHWVGSFFQTCCGDITFPCRPRSFTYYDSWFECVFAAVFSIYGTFYEILTLVGLYSVLFKSLYLLQGFRYRCPTLYHTVSLCVNIYLCLSQSWCRCYEVRYLMGFKTATSSGRSVQIASNLACFVEGY